ncbi:hypothetical protein BS17DRAFT_767970 [Gyrodon lividus]|nr:hypothetical protein BS17DRAFT_767970 [Gyrodon lividus]
MSAFVDRTVMCCTLQAHCKIRNKAVAEGAVSYHIDHLVSSRVARFTYGTECSVPFDSSDTEHRARLKSVYRGPSGQLALPHGFGSILMRGTRVSEKQEFEEAFAIRRTSQVACNTVEVDITSYRGSLAQPSWMDTERDQFSTLCTVRADTSKLAKTLSGKRSPEGSLYYAIDIRVILMFGLTELTAQTLRLLTLVSGPYSTGMALRVKLLPHINHCTVLLMG